MSEGSDIPTFRPEDEKKLLTLWVPVITARCAQCHNIVDQMVVQASTPRNLDALRAAAVWSKTIEQSPLFPVELKSEQCSCAGKQLPIPQSAEMAGHLIRAWRRRPFTPGRNMKSSPLVVRL
jgi:hypothetical protein